MDQFYSLPRFFNTNNELRKVSKKLGESKGLKMGKVFINGDIVDRKDAKIDIEDRGFQFGDGIYEVIGIHKGKPFALQKHLHRFRKSAEKLSIPFEYSNEDIKNIVLGIINVNQLASGLVYIQLTRGVSLRTHQFPKPSVKPTLIAYTMKMKPPVELQEYGVNCLLDEDMRWGRCDIKSLNLLGSVLAKEKAIKNDCYETILHRDRIITEASSTNVFIVKSGSLFTHPANHHILNGVTRQVVLEICQHVGFKVFEKPFTVDDLFQADEVFLTGTFSSILPVNQVADQYIQDGHPGPMTKKLQQHFFEIIEEGYER